VLLVGLSVLAVGASQPAAGSRSGPGAPAAAVRIDDADLAPVLARGRARVTVRADRAGVFRLFAAAVPALGRDAPIVVTRTVVVRVRGGQSRTVALPVIAAGRRLLAGCASWTIEARAAALTGRGGTPGRTYRGRRRLAARSAACRPGPGATTNTAPSGTRSSPAGAGGGRGRGDAAPIDYPTENADRCDIIDPAVCLQPFPNDYFTVADSTTETGRRVELNLLSMPRNKAGKPIDPADIDRNDGFGPGSPIVTRVPGLDNAQAFQRTGAVPITDLARTYDLAQPVVVINTRTLARQLIWAEIDSNPSNPANVNLIIRPAKNLEEGTRYIVALRDLRDAQGSLLPPSGGFRLYRDRVITTNPQVEARRDHFEGIFGTLAAAGIDRANLYLAWDFTVASERSLSERQLAIRDDAYRQLGDTKLADLKVQGHAPAYEVTKVTDLSPADNSQIARRVEGTFSVPCYLNLPGCPSGSRFLYPPGSKHGPPVVQPIPGNTMSARFTCNVPRVAMESGGARPSLYGHGLFGSRGEVNQGQLQAMAQEHDFVFCATDWVGMACSDIPNGDTPNQVFTQALAGHAPNLTNCDIPTALADESDLSNFPTLVDRVEQAFVNFMYLGRLMIHPDGFSANAAFQNAPGHGVIDTTRLFYDGNSQGGIFGGSLIALEPDLDRGVVGVPGMNYSLLLQRSSDFGTGAPPKPDPRDPRSVLPEYAYPLYQAYPNELERQLILSLIQQMWDHSDPNGLAQHMTSDPLPNTPAHQVLMHVGLGDHQVSQYAAEVQARTIGARAHVPWADTGRFSEVDPTYGIPAIAGYPYDGSAIALWDIGPIRNSPCEPGASSCGTDPPPTTNTPPNRGEDPHEFPRRSAAARQQKSEFLRVGGRVVDVCGGRPCYAGAWTGP
jgi:hypothetical protein